MTINVNGKELATLDSIEHDLTEWRDSKHLSKQNAIPDKLWIKIFSLECKYSPARIRTFFKLNSTQYSKKHAEFAAPATIQESPANKIVDVFSNNQSLKPSSSKASSFVELGLSNIAPPLLSGYIDKSKQMYKNKSKQMYKNIKQTKVCHDDILDNTTAIFEVVRNDGVVLKINATNMHVGEVLQAFLADKVTA